MAFCSPLTLSTSLPRENSMVLFPSDSLKFVQRVCMEYLEIPGLYLVLGLLSGQLGAVKMGQ